MFAQVGMGGDWPRGLGSAIAEEFAYWQMLAGLAAALFGLGLCFSRDRSTSLGGVVFVSVGVGIGLVYFVAIWATEGEIPTGRSWFIPLGGSLSIAACAVWRAVVRRE